MSLESVAAAARTTVPSLRRRFADKAALASAAIDSLRVEPLPDPGGPPRAQALAILENFGRNLRRRHSLALLGTLLAEEPRNPLLLEQFRQRLARPRRHALEAAVRAGIECGDLPGDHDVELTVNMLIGSFYGRYVARGSIPRNWPGRVLAQVWPDPQRSNT